MPWDEVVLLEGREGREVLVDGRVAHPAPVGVVVMVVVRMVVVAVLVLVAAVVMWVLLLLVASVMMLVVVVVMLVLLLVLAAALGRGRHRDPVGERLGVDHLWWSGKKQMNEARVLTAYHMSL